MRPGIVRKGKGLGVKVLTAAARKVHRHFERGMTCERDLKSAFAHQKWPTQSLASTVNLTVPLNG